MKHSWWNDNWYHCTRIVPVLIAPYCSCVLSPLPCTSLFIYSWLISECDLIMWCHLKVCYMYYMSIKLFSLSLLLSILDCGYVCWQFYHSAGCSRSSSKQIYLSSSLGHLLMPGWCWRQNYASCSSRHFYSSLPKPCGVDWTFSLTGATNEV